MRRRYKHAESAFAVMLGCCSPASAMTPAQRNVVNHAAHALAAEAMCPAFRANLVLINATMIASGVSPARDDVNERLQRRVVEIMKEMSGRSQVITCISFNTLYGPRGQNVEGFITPK